MLSTGARVEDAGKIGCVVPNRGTDLKDVSIIGK